MDHRARVWKWQLYWCPVHPHLTLSRAYGPQFVLQISASHNDIISFLALNLNERCRHGKKSFVFIFLNIFQNMLEWVSLNRIEIQKPITAGGSVSDGGNRTPNPQKQNYVFLFQHVLKKIQKKKIQSFPFHADIVHSK